MNLYLKQSVFTIRDRLTFFDQSQRAVYHVTGSLFAVPRRLDITEAGGGRRLMQVRLRLFTLFRTYTLRDSTQGNRTIGTIRRRFTLTKSFCVRINGERLRLKGSLFGFQFALLNKAGETLLNIRKRLIAWGDTYEVFIDDTKINPEIAASICVAFDSAVHGGSSKVTRRRRGRQVKRR